MSTQAVLIEHSGRCRKAWHSLSRDASDHKIGGCALKLQDLTASCVPTPSSAEISRRPMSKQLDSCAQKCCVTKLQIAAHVVEFRYSGGRLEQSECLDLHASLLVIAMLIPPSHTAPHASAYVQRAVWQHLSQHIATMFVFSMLCQALNEQASNLRRLDLSFTCWLGQVGLAQSWPSRSLVMIGLHAASDAATGPGCTPARDHGKSRQVSHSISQMCADSLLAKTPEMALVHFVKSFGICKGAQKCQKKRVTLVKRFSNVPSPSQHQLQPSPSAMCQTAQKQAHIINFVDVLHNWCRKTRHASSEHKIQAILGTAYPWPQRANLKHWKANVQRRLVSCQPRIIDKTSQVDGQPNGR
eukprot:5001430-Pleurochrysis_carterae.AAC.5